MAEPLLIGLAAIVVLGIGSQWLAWRLRLPSILLLLIAGFLAGPLLGIVDPDRLFGDLLFPIVSISVAVILFEGGLTLQLTELPRIGNVLFRLISIGALVTWAIAAAAAHYILGLDLALSVLLGAILIVTGPTVIAPLLRQIQPKGQVGAALKWEGILIDPVGAVLAVLVFEVIRIGELSSAPGVLLNGVLLTILIGLGVGAAGAALLIFLLRRFLVPDYLENGVTLLVLVTAFALSNSLHPESGLLTVTVMGLLIANQRWVSIKHIVDFKENLQVLLIGSLFILLSARLDPRVLLEQGWKSLAFLAVLILIGRPLAILFSTLGSDFSRAQRLFMAWMAPRGIVAAAVASIFAFELVEAGYEGAEQLVPLTFLVIVGTVSFYGLTAGPIARWLQLSEEDPQGVLIVGAHPVSRAIASTLQEYNVDVRLLDTSWENIRLGRMAGLDIHYGNALSEEVLEKLDLGGIGRLLAMTSNDEVNSLAALHFPDVFSRAEVYQLPLRLNTQQSQSVQSVPPQHMTGRFLFGTHITFDYLMQRFQQGARIRATPLTEKFDYQAFQKRHDNNAVPLFVITEKKRLLIYTADSPPKPKAGQILISLTDPLPEEQEATAQVLQPLLGQSSGLL